MKDRDIIISKNATNSGRQAHPAHAEITFFDIASISHIFQVKKFDRSIFSPKKEVLFQPTQSMDLLASTSNETYKCISTMERQSTHNLKRYFRSVKIIFYCFPYVHTHTSLNWFVKPMTDWMEWISEMLIQFHHSRSIYVWLNVVYWKHVRLQLELQQWKCLMQTFYYEWIECSWLYLLIVTVCYIRWERICNGN